MKRTVVWGLAGAALLAGAAGLVVPAEAGVAAAEGTAAACSLVAESITATGTDAGSVITATTPPSKSAFGAVKSMALISKTPTYDTFLANLRGGSLYTIRIPTTAPMKPIVKQVRAGTWQGFEKLTATKCGLNSTLLLGIDKDTKSGYLYAVGHANGTATVIQSRGKVNGTFPDPVNFRWGVVADLDVLNGD